MKTIHSPLLSAFSNLMAHFTTRHGGCSIGPYDSANLAFHVGDLSENVIANHDRLSALLGYNRHSLVHMRQIHSDRILVVDESMHFDTPPECDALITDRPDIPLMVMSADCTPILIYDAVRHAIGAIHAGRQGALKSILPKTIQKMQESFGSDLEDLYITMGPSIHGCCYEINAEIAEETEEKGYKEALRTQGEKVFLDVNTILKMQLEALKIASDRIDIIDHCTSCRSDTYFSYRADKQHTGRIAGIIMLRQ